MLKQCRNVRSSTDKDELSMFELSFVQKALDMEKRTSADISKQIKNEIQLRKKIEKCIEKGIEKITEEGSSLSQTYEMEQQKHKKLTALVGYYERIFYESKVQRYEDIKNKIQTDKFEEQCHILKHKEKEIKKILDKYNNSGYEITRKIDAIRSLRSERTIFSSLFENIERELCNLEHCYKVLVIDRAIQESQYLRSVNGFNAHEQKQKRIQEAEGTKDGEKQITIVNTKADETQLCSDKNISKRSQFSKQRRSAEVLESKSQFDEASYIRKEQLEQECEIMKQKIVKMVFDDFGISSFRDFPLDLCNIEASNMKELSWIYYIDEQIANMKKSIRELKSQKIIEECKEGKTLFKFKHLKESLKAQYAKEKLEKEEISDFFSQIRSLVPKNDQIEHFNSEEEILRLMLQLNEQTAEIPCLFKVHHAQKADNKNNKRLSHLFSSEFKEENRINIFDEQELISLAKERIQQHKLRRVDSQ